MGGGGGGGGGREDSQSDRQINRQRAREGAKRAQIKKDFETETHRAGDRKRKRFLLRKSASCFLVTDRLPLAHVNDIVTMITKHQSQPTLPYSVSMRFMIKT